MTRPTKKFGTALEVEQPRCQECDPPDSLRHELGSGIGVYRARHYLTFNSTDDLADHLRKYARFPAPVMGYDFEGWLHSVLVWHRNKRVQQASDAKRWA